MATPGEGSTGEEGTGEVSQFLQFHGFDDESLIKIVTEDLGFSKVDSLLDGLREEDDFEEIRGELELDEDGAARLRKAAAPEMSELFDFCVDLSVSSAQFNALVYDLEIDSMVALSAAIADTASWKAKSKALKMKLGVRKGFELAVKAKAKVHDSDETKSDDTTTVVVDDVEEPVSRKKHARSDGRSISKDKDAVKHDIPAFKGPKKEVSLVFVGQTGVGKTTLLKALEDFIDGVAFEDIKPTPKCGAAGMSQTQEVDRYTLTNSEWLVHIIDTPGIGDTAGAATDQRHMDDIIDFIGGSGEFNAICFLFKKGDPRATPSLRYIVNEIKMHLPKDMKNNLVTLLTRSEVPTPDKDTMAVLKQLGLPTKNIIPINNLAYEEQAYIEDDGDDAEDGFMSGDMARESVRIAAKSQYSLNMKFLRMLLEYSHKMPAYRAEKMMKLKVKRNLLKEKVGLLRRKMDDGYEMERQCTENLAKLQLMERKKASYKDFKKTEKYLEYEYVKETGKISTACNACSKVCHIDCCLGYGDDLSGCWCISGSKCDQCGCSVTVHAHLGWKVLTHEKSHVVHDKDLEEKWHHSASRVDALKARELQIRKQLKKVKEEREAAQHELLEVYVELQSMATIGYNESFGAYMDECVKAIEKDPKLTFEEKKEKKERFEGWLTDWQTLHSVVQAGAALIGGKVKAGASAVGRAFSSGASAFSAGGSSLAMY
jgi:DNA polymerase III delta prime subunit